MQVINLIEVMDAAHLSHFVDSPFHRRGGMLLIGPPGTLKTTLLKCALGDYQDALCLSDINVQQLIVIRDDIAAKRYNTLGFFALEKIYQRHSATSSNIEGHLQAMAEEGFTVASFEDQRLQSIAAKCLVVAAMTQTLYRQKFTGWMSSGFARRFLHCLYTMKNADTLMDSVQKWEPVILDGIIRKWPAGRIIPMKLDEPERRLVRKSLRYQPGDTTPYQLALRILAVLKWKYGPKKASEIWLDFAECLGQNGAQVEL